jgi:hypothetical protein
MTRVTNDLRGSMERQIMAGLPVIDYVKLIHELVQEVVIEHAPEQVRVMYDNPDLRDYLANSQIQVKVGNKHVPMWQGKDRNTESIRGLTKGITINMMDDAGRMPERSLYRTLIAKLKASGLVDKYFGQDDLRDSVRKRLKANLAASKTFKQLYANLEPELHHYIPKDETAAQLPACVAPVVDDLRKLGADLPTVPKATTA